MLNAIQKSRFYILHVILISLSPHVSCLPLRCPLRINAKKKIVLKKESKRNQDLTLLGMCSNSTVTLKKKKQKGANKKPVLKSEFHPAEMQP